MRGRGIARACAAWMTLIVVGSAMAQTTSGPVQPDGSAPRASVVEKLRLKSVTLHIFHRAFEGFHDQVEAKIGQEFRVGDSNYSAVVTQFVPDFAMDLKTRKVTTRGNAPNNPAFRVVVRRGGQPVDTTWAFLNMPPHFARKSLVAFLATRATFENHAPIASRDSLAVRLMQLEGR